ncbi:Phosphomevalonate kinase [Chytriomyces sp. MP71]|nr:Phosphomevalonate kinase [Chytriomyces sp. MP71]
MTSDEHSTCVSAPGKVLVCGGYLVLDPQYSGLVIGTDSRFFSTVSARIDSQQPPRRILVRSPQFDDGKWEFDLDERFGVNPASRKDGKPAARNKFVEYALQLCFSVISASSSNFDVRFGSWMEIVIVGHNDFYSQRPQLEKLGLPITTASLRSLKPFCPTLTTIGDVHKTGLGSSAAMITSLVAALLSHFGVNTSTKDDAFIHNMAQFVHCLAQGKVGSGFDVSSAIYGSHLYKRFDPDIIASLMSRCEEVGVYKVSADEILKVVKETKWDSEVTPMKLPPRVRLMLADVDAGSSTPKLVGGVLGWRKANPIEAEKLWGKLDAENMRVAKVLMNLSQIANLNGKEYEDAVGLCGRTVSSSWIGSENRAVKLFGEAASSFLNVRHHLRTMSALANVPIEPPSQTRLLNSIAALPGIIMTGVPGAGGFDAIFVLVIDTPGNAEAVEGVWAQWSESKVGPLLAGASDDGFKKVHVADVEGLARLF